MKKLIALLASAVLLVGLVSCGGTGSGAEASGVTGTYEGVAQGHNGEIKVEVELKNGKIETITILEHQETEGASDPAFEQVPVEIKKSQSLNVDTVSGATVSSEGIIAAVKDALEKAGVDMSEYEA